MHLAADTRPHSCTRRRATAHTRQHASTKDAAARVADSFDKTCAFLSPLLFVFGELLHHPSFVANLAASSDRRSHGTRRTGYTDETECSDRTYFFVYKDSTDGVN